LARRTKTGQNLIDQLVSYDLSRACVYKNKVTAVLFSVNF